MRAESVIFLLVSLLFSTGLFCQDKQYFDKTIKIFVDQPIKSNNLFVTLQNEYSRILPKSVFVNSREFYLFKNNSASPKQDIILWSFGEKNNALKFVFPESFTPENIEIILIVSVPKETPNFNFEIYDSNPGQDFNGKVSHKIEELK